ncbi:hypothetical protein U0070_016177, partial [Myodes glareolus]
AQHCYAKPPSQATTPTPWRLKIAAITFVHESQPQLTCGGKMVSLSEAFLLTFWHLSTTAHETTVSVPPIVSEGDNVLFLVHNLPEEIESLAWFKGLGDAAEEIAAYTLHSGLSRPGPAHSSRETIYHNGSMLFEKVNLKDTEFYTLRTYNRSGKIVSTANVYLNVYAFLWKCGCLAPSAQTTVESLPSSVAEGESALLLVHNLPENILEFLWYKGEVDSKNLLAMQPIPARKPTVWGPAYSGRETLHSDGSLLLRDVTEKDHGLYTLRILRTDMGIEEAQVKLQVDSSHSLFCDTLTSSQLMIQAEPRYVSEGEDVLLQVHNLPEDVQAFSWHKSKDGSPIFKLNRAMPSISWDVAQRTKGMAFQNGSLLLQDITEKDAGMYTLEVLNKNFKIEKAYVKFYVKKPVTQPFVRITDTTVSGGTSVIFTCISPNTDVSVRWIFNKKTLQLTERMTLSPTKCGLRIDPVKREDAGEYQCEISNRFGLKTSLPVSWP